jgi:ribonuclease HII
MRMKKGGVFSHELKASFASGLLEAGCDEAGRGCLAGPVFAAAVILPSGYSHPLIIDSKKLSAPLRDKLRIEIETNALAWAVGYVDNHEIDSINILRASIRAMHIALSSLTIQPDHILVDGNFFTSFKDISHTCLVRGDSIYSSIAAASILAKTHRDEFMCNLHREYPVYGWAMNKGYPTRFHCSALLEHGPCPYHRKTFRPVSGQLTLDIEYNAEVMSLSPVCGRGVQDQGRDDQSD